MAEEDSQQQRERHGYNRILQRAREYLDEFEERAGDAVARAVDRAKERSRELGELVPGGGRACVGIRPAGHGRRRCLGGGIRRGIRSVAALRPGAGRAATNGAFPQGRGPPHGGSAPTWQAGEITRVGTLRCEGCGEALHFSRSAHIPPCRV
jgi:hypothetical protein